MGTQQGHALGPWSKASCQLQEAIVREHGHNKQWTQASNAPPCTAWEMRFKISMIVLRMLQHAENVAVFCNPRCGACSPAPSSSACISRACPVTMRRWISCRTPSVRFSATNLLHHWQQQDPTLWPGPHKKQQLPVPKATPAASAPQQQQFQQTPVHMSTANLALQGAHTWRHECFLPSAGMYQSASIQPQASQKQEQLFLPCLCRHLLCSQLRQQGTCLPASTASSTQALLPRRRRPPRVGPMPLPLQSHRAFHACHQSSGILP